MAAATSPNQAESLRWAFERFERFAGLLDIVPKKGQRIKLALNEIQRAYCAARTPRDVVLKPRQVGFTTLEQARDVFTLLTMPGARVVATCQSISDHAPLIALSRNYEVMFDSLERLNIKLNFTTRSKNEWTLGDRDASLRIVEAGASEAAAQKKGRSGTITRLHLTETAFYEYAGETLNALLECVPGPEHGSEIVSESTANGSGGTFYEQYTNAVAGKTGYTAHFFPWFIQGEYSLRPFRDEVIEPNTDTERMLVSQFGVKPGQLKWYQRKLAEKGSQGLMDQEYPSDPKTCFLVAGRLFFDRARTTALRAEAKQPIERKLGGALRVWKRPVVGAKYLLVADPSEGDPPTPDADLLTKKKAGNPDPGAACVYERTTGEHVATLHGFFPVGRMAELLDTIGREYNNAEIVVERNNHGHAVLALLALSTPEHKPYPAIWRDRDDKPGWNTTPTSRPAMLDRLEDAHRNGRWSSPDDTTLGEFLTFIVNNDGKAEASSGMHDDLVMVAAIAHTVLTTSIPQPVARATVQGSRLGSGRGY